MKDVYNGQFKVITGYFMSSKWFVCFWIQHVKMRLCISNIIQMITSHTPNIDICRACWILVYVEFSYPSIFLLVSAPGAASMGSGGQLPTMWICTALSWLPPAHISSLLLFCCCYFVCHLVCLTLIVKHDNLLSFLEPVFVRPKECPWN